MLNYPLGFCQIKKGLRVIIFILCVVLLSFFSSCSTSEEKGLLVRDWTTVQGSARWFVHNPLYNYTNQDGENYIHPFYDLVPFVDYEELLTNFYVTTPSGSKKLMRFDLNSGRKVYDLPLCEREDLSKKYSSTISTPNFTLGIVPRILNQVGEPLQIMVFGNDGFFQKNHGESAHQVRVVGGIVLKYCNVAFCGESDAEKFMVLVGVDPRDKDLKGVKHIRDLKKRVDFDYTIAFWNNLSTIVEEGSKRHFPAYHLINEVGPYATYKRTMSKKLILKADVLEKIRLNCLKLYQKAWNNLGKIKFYGRPKKNGTAIDIPSDKFASGFRDFYRKVGKEYMTCLKYVKSNAGGKNYSQLNFFVHFDAFFKIINLGHVYDCKTKNFRFKSSGLTAYEETLKEIQGCGAKEIDFSFAMTKVYMNYLSNAQMRHYRYIDYDNGVHGTHEKVFSWVLDEGKKPYCGEKLITEKRDIFPDKINWPLFDHYYYRKFKL